MTGLGCSFFSFSFLSKAHIVFRLWCFIRVFHECYSQRFSEEKKKIWFFLNLKNKSPDRLGGCWVQCCQVGLFYQTLVWNQTQVKSLAIIDSSFALKVFLFTFSYMDTVKYRLNYLFKTERFMFLNFCPNCLKANFRLSLIFTKNNVFFCRIFTFLCDFQIDSTVFYNKKYK